MNPIVIGTTHRRRLRQVWRSAGWPSQDLIEVELLAAGLLARKRDADGRETLRVTDAGVAQLAATLQNNRAAHAAHEALVARAMQRAGRLVWRDLSLSARSGDGDDAAWAMARPDLYSSRQTTVEEYAEPTVHEIKVPRADLLSDLRRVQKGQAYRQLCSQCWYVLREGIGQAGEIPDCFGVMVAGESALEVLRPAPRRALKLPFSIWMALARAAPEPDDDDAQGQLGAPKQSG